MNQWSHKIWGGLALVTITFASARAEITLTDIKQQKATVEVTDASPTEVSFVFQGRKITMNLDQLSPDSRTAAIDYAKKKGVFHVFPPLTIQVKVGYQQRNSAKNWYVKDVTMKPSVVIEGSYKLTGVPAAEATLLIITHDTEEKYVKNIEKMKVMSAETLPVPAASTGERREFAFQSVAMSFDTARDTTNVGGQEYKYFIFGLRDPATGDFVDFESNSPNVMNYVATHPEARSALLASGQGSSFSEDFR